MCLYGPDVVVLGDVCCLRSLSVRDRKRTAGNCISWSFFYYLWMVLS